MTSENYTQASGAALTEYFGNTLSVTANARLSGALHVRVIPECPPAHGAAFAALTFGSRNGLFTGHTPGLRLRTGSHSIVVINRNPTTRSDGC
jgi:hypothetical protein